MNKLELANIKDEFDNANAMLEMCRGYAQADMPDMKAMEIALYILINKYNDLYKRLCEVKGV